MGLSLLLLLFLENPFILHKDHLLEDNPLIGVFNALKHGVLLRELPQAIGVHVEGHVCTLVLQARVELRLLRHGLKHDRIGHIVVSFEFLGLELLLGLGQARFLS